MDSLTICSSELDRELTLLKPTTGAKDAYNADTITYAVYDTVYCRREEAGAKQFYAAEKLHNERRVRFKIFQFDETPTVEWQVQFDGVNYEIHQLEEIGRGEGWLIYGVQVIP